MKRKIYPYHYTRGNIADLFLGVVFEQNRGYGSVVSLTVWIQLWMIRLFGCSTIGWKNWEKIAFAPATVPPWGDERFRRIINDTTRQVVRGVSLAWSNRWMQKRDNGGIPKILARGAAEEAKGTWMSNYLHPPRQSLEGLVGSLVLVKRGCISFSFPREFCYITYEF